jgi:carbon starvation protein
MGLTHRFRRGRIEATVVGVIGMVLAVVLGKPVAASSIGHWFLLSRQGIIIAMAAYGFVAAVLPVWLLLVPRDYLSAYMKIGTIAFLVLAVVIVHPSLEMPAFSQFVGGGGPVILVRCSRLRSSPARAGRSRASTRWCHRGPRRR